MSDWYLAVCGVNHRSSSLNQRASLQIGSEDIARAHVLCAGLPGIREVVVVCTCNRVEFYFVADRRASPQSLMASFYRRFKDLDSSEFEALFYRHQDREAARHLFRVAAGLDSMVLGESQIFGQVKEAYRAACCVKTAGKVMHRLFHQGFRVGKQVRTETEMGRGNCSVSSAAVELLQSRLQEMREPTILFVGASPMIALAAASLSKGLSKGLSKECGGRFLFANRTLSKASALAAKHGGEAHPLARLPELIERSDIVVTCTSAPEPLLTADMFSSLRGIPERRMLVIDMAVPRDVEESVRGQENVELFDMEDIQKFVREQQDRRRDAIPKAEEIIELKLAEFAYWFEQIRCDPLYQGLENSFEEIREQEMASVLEKLPPGLREEVNQATRRLVDKLLQLKERASAASQGA